VLDEPQEDVGGVSGIADTAENLNVPPVPQPDDVTNIVSTPAPSSNDTPIFTGFDLNPNVAAPPPNTVVTVATGHAFRPTVTFAKIMPMLATLRRQTGDIIYESSNDLGDVMTVFEDYSLVAITAEGEEYLRGYLALNAAGSVIIVGTDAKGYQYVFDSDYLIGLTANGNVFMGIAEFLYFYDYDEDGNFLALSDSEGNEYDVEFDADGNFTITDAEGNIGEFYADGSYAMYDEDGNFLEEGDWLPDDDSSLSDEGNDDIINDDDYGDDDGFNDDGGDDDGSDYGDEGGDDDGGDYGDEG
jgi:hypothetical protein